MTNTPFQLSYATPRTDLPPKRPGRQFVHLAIALYLLSMFVPALRGTFGFSGGNVSTLYGWEAAYFSLRFTGMGIGDVPTCGLAANLAFLVAYGLYWRVNGRRGRLRRRWTSVPLAAAASAAIAAFGSVSLIVIQPWDTTPQIGCIVWLAAQLSMLVAALMAHFAARRFSLTGYASTL